MYSDAETMRCIGSDLLGSMCLQVREWYTAYVLCAHVNELCLSTSDHYLCAKWSLFLRRLVFVCRHNRNRIAKWKIYLPKHVATPRGIWVECRYILLGNIVVCLLSLSQIVAASQMGNGCICHVAITTCVRLICAKTDWCWFISRTSAQYIYLHHDNLPNARRLYRVIEALHACCISLQREKQTRISMGFPRDPPQTTKAHPARRKIGVTRVIISYVSCMIWFEWLPHWSIWCLLIWHKQMWCGDEMTR